MANDTRDTHLDPDAVRIGTILRDLRNANGWTLARLGDAIGKTHHFLSKVERGHRAATVPLCRDIANAYGIPPDRLIKVAFPSSPGVDLSIAHHHEQQRPA